MYQDPSHTITRTPPLRIAIGKGRGFHEVLELVHTTDTTAFHSFYTGEVPVYHDPGANLTLLTVRSRDLSWLLEQGHIDVAIGSSIWFHEYGFPSLGCIQQLPLQQCRFSIIAPPGITLQDIRTICTKFTRITTQYLEHNQLTARVISMEGSHETALYLRMAEAIGDVIETGSTIRRMGFHELDCLLPLSHEIWTRNADEVTRKRLTQYLKQPVC